MKTAKMFLFILPVGILYISEILVER